MRIGRWQIELRRSAVWLLIIIAALIAFEMFNFSTTEYALHTFFGPHDVLGMASWATILAVAFCGIDFAGLSRLLTPESEWHREPKEIWLLTAAWFLGAGMNAVMTWWAVSNALTENLVPGNALISREQILQIVPVFVAVLVWLTRIMLIGSIAAAQDRSVHQSGIHPRPARRSAPPAQTRARRETPPLPQRKNIPLPQRAASPARVERASTRASSVRQVSRTTQAADSRRPLPRRFGREPSQPRPAARWQQSGTHPERPSSPASSAKAAASAPANELVYVDLD